MSNLRQTKVAEPCDNKLVANILRADTDELFPCEGEDEPYDTIMAEISGLEEELESDLKKLEKKIG